MDGLPRDLAQELLGGRLVKVHVVGTKINRTHTLHINWPHLLSMFSSSSAATADLWVHCAPAHAIPALASEQFMLKSSTASEYLKATEDSHANQIWVGQSQKGAMDFVTGKTLQHACGDNTRWFTGTNGVGIGPLDITRPYSSATLFVDLSSIPQMELEYYHVPFKCHGFSDKEERLHTISRAMPHPDSHANHWTSCVFTPAGPGTPLGIPPVAVVETHGTAQYGRFAGRCA